MRVLISSACMLVCNHSVLITSFLVTIKCAGIYGVVFSGAWRVLAVMCASVALAAKGRLPFKLADVLIHTIVESVPTTTLFAGPKRALTGSGPR